MVSVTAHAEVVKLSSCAAIARASLQHSKTFVSTGYIEVDIVRTSILIPMCACRVCVLCNSNSRHVLVLLQETKLDACNQLYRDFGKPELTMAQMKALDLRTCCFCLSQCVMRSGCDLPFALCRSRPITGSVITHVISKPYERMFEAKTSWIWPKAICTAYVIDVNARRLRCVCVMVFGNTRHIYSNDSLNTQDI